MIYIVMGVSGCGKTTVGKLLSKKLQLPFYDADNFHPEASITKMRSGIPLDDQDRQDWLQTLSSKIIQWENEGGAVLACSALKEKYRSILQSLPPNQISWIFLKGALPLISERLANRRNHFMSASLLQSQFEALEEPAYGIHVPIDDAPEQIVQHILKNLV
ncbi:MAG: gluconokinase [Chitinophagaceae bacterium]|nr:gluconokinase [Chitinophagaceae bacterium]